jgi:hypothetical protein
MAGTEIIFSPALELQPAPLFTPTPKAAKRVLEFFTAQVNNDHTRAVERRSWRRRRPIGEQRLVLLMWEP